MVYSKVNKKEGAKILKIKNMKKIVFLYVVFIIAMLVGEIKCICKAVNCNWDPIGKAEIVYTVSACTGIGAVVGYINIQDK